MCPPPPSPSQGPCCRTECTYKVNSEMCRMESECAQEGKCNGLSPRCPASEPKKNLTTCHSDTQVCLNGVRRPPGPVHRTESHEGVTLWWWDLIPVQRTVGYGLNAD